MVFKCCPRTQKFQFSLKLPVGGFQEEGSHCTTEITHSLKIHSWDCMSQQICFQPE